MPTASIVMDQIVFDITPLCATCLFPSPYKYTTPVLKKADEF
jgi:hypothetical protein